MVERVASAAAEEDGDAEEPPEQCELDAFLGPEIAVGPLIDEDDHRHLDPDRHCGKAGEKTQGEKGRGEGLGENRGVSEQGREGQTVLRDAVRRTCRRQGHELYDPVREQDRAGGKAHEAIGIARAGLIETGQRWKHEPVWIDIVIVHGVSLPIAYSFRKNGAALAPSACQVPAKPARSVNKVASSAVAATSRPRKSQLPCMTRVRTK